MPRRCVPRTWGIFVHWHALIDARDPRFTLLAPVSEIEEPLAQLESSIRVSMWNMLRQYSIYAMRNAAPMDLGLRRRGVELRFILPRRIAEQRCPLASSYELGLRLSPVVYPLMVLDGRMVLVGDSTGDSVWTSSAPQVVAEAVGFYERLWRASEPAVPEGEEPPFTRRMVAIAFLLVDGATDRATLGLSSPARGRRPPGRPGRAGCRRRARGRCHGCGGC